MSSPLFYQLLLCAITTALLLLGLIADGTINSGIIVSATALLSVLIPTYYYCSLSEKITQDLYSVGGILYDFNWYLLPVKHQKLFIYPIRRAEMGFRMKGFGIVDCSLSVFLSVRYFINCC